MINARQQELECLDSGRLRTTCFSSQFMTKLLERGRFDYDRVCRWTKDMDTFEHGKILIPGKLQPHNMYHCVWWSTAYVLVHRDMNHWGLIVVKPRERSVMYYDSLKKDGTRFLNATLEWLKHEAICKKRAFSVWNFRERLGSDRSRAQPTTAGGRYWVWGFCMH